MMDTVERFVTSATPERIWAILADVERWREWTPTVLSIEPLTAGGLRMGAKYRVTQPKLRPTVYEVTACVPNEAFTWVQRLPGGGLIADHRIAAKDEGSEVELSFRSNGWLAGLVSTLFSKTIREYVATEARSLKQKCESA
jgi:carbon monoxide dehydrogenase subunit G